MKDDIYMDAFRDELAKHIPVFVSILENEIDRILKNKEPSEENDGRLAGLNYLLDKIEKI